MRACHQLTWGDFSAAVGRLSARLSDLPRSNLAGILPMPRGGFPLAVALAHRLDLPLIGRPRPNQPFLWVDDLIDTGKTLGEWEAVYPFLLPVVWLVRASFADRQRVTAAAVAPPETWLIFPWEATDRAAADRRDFLARRGTG